jgi:hypothetical protein
LTGAAAIASIRALTAGSIPALYAPEQASSAATIAAAMPNRTGKMRALIRTGKSDRSANCRGYSEAVMMPATQTDARRLRTEWRDPFEAKESGFYASPP